MRMAPGISMDNPELDSGSSRLMLLLLAWSGTTEGTAAATAFIMRGVISKTNGSIVTNHHMVKPMERTDRSAGPTLRACK